MIIELIGGPKDGEVEEVPDNRHEWNFAHNTRKNEVQNPESKPPHNLCDLSFKELTYRRNIKPNKYYYVEPI